MPLDAALGRDAERATRAGRYRGAKETKRGGTGVWKSERLVVPENVGNLTAGTRGREGAAA